MASRRVDLSGLGHGKDVEWWGELGPLAQLRTVRDKCFAAGSVETFLGPDAVEADLLTPRPAKPKKLSYARRGHSTRMQPSAVDRALPTLSTRPHALPHSATRNGNSCSIATTDSSDGKSTVIGASW
jgi:hypothetical protein